MKSQLFSSLVAAIVLTSGVSGATRVYRREVEICTRAGNQTNPHVFFPFLFWQDDRNGDWDIYGYDFRTETEYAICVAEGNQTNPRMRFGSILDEEIVVWEDDRNGNSDIYGYRLLHGLHDLAFGSEIAICIDPSDQRNPGSLGSYVYWQDNRDGGWDIRVKYYDDFEAPSETVLCGQDGDQINPYAEWHDLRMFVWQDNRHGGWDIYGSTRPFNEGTSIMSPGAVPAEPDAASALLQQAGESDVIEQAICAEQGDQTHPSSSRYAVVWQDDRSGNNDIYGRFCLDTLCSESTEIGVCTEHHDQMYPSVFGGVVVWQDNRNGGWDIYGCRMEDYVKGTEFVVSTAEGDQIRPVSDGYAMVVVWEDWRDGNGDIYAAMLSLRGNDDCGEFAVELFDDQPYSGSTEGMSATLPGPDEQPLISSCGFYDFADAWHVYKPTVGGPATITTAGSSLDTVLSVFNSCPTALADWPDIRHEAIELACNDDYCPEHAGSKVTLDVVGGKTYYIRVAGFNNQTGEYRIVVRRDQAMEPVKSDLNQDGAVNTLDLAIFASEWLASI